MDELTSLIKGEIKRQYKSVRQFSAKIGVPQSTIISGLNKGVSGMAFDTVLKMCNYLDIKLSVNLSLFMDKDKAELLETFSQLDERGKQTVKSVCTVEFLRCKNIPVMNIASALEKKQNTSETQE